MENEESKPGTVTVATLILVGLLVPALVTSFLVFDLQPSLASPGGSATSVQTSVLVEIPAGVGSNSSLNYEPAVTKVVVGLNNTITWIQQDPIPHTVTSTSVPNGASSFDSNNMNKGDSFSVTLSVPGTYEYGCVYHPGWMKGSIIVVAPVSSQSVSVILPNGVGSNPNINFNPVNIVIVIGVNNTVTFENLDNAIHTVTATDKSFDSGNIAAGANWNYTFTTPGNFSYFCVYHSWMKGNVVVKQGTSGGLASVTIPAGTGGNPSLSFQPATFTLVIGVNSTVTFTNLDSTTHTVTALDGGFDSGNILAGRTWSHTFSTPGSYPYHCIYHAWMTGTIVVKSP